MIHLKNNMNKKDLIYFAVGILTAAVFLAVDLITKQIIINKMLYNSEIVVIKNFFSITPVLLGVCFLPKRIFCPL